MAELFNPDKIRELRKKWNFTTMELGRKIGASNVAVTKWETGKALPNPNYLKSLADVFGVSVDIFYTKTDTA